MAGKKNNKTLWTIVAIVSAIVLVVCGVSIVQRIAQDNEANRENQEMAELAYTITPVPTATPEPTPEMTASPEPATPTPSPTLPPVPQEIDFAALHEENPEIFSWIKVDGTQIDYPVLCRVGDDAYYHTHTVKGKKAVAGSIYIQAGWNKQDWSDFHTVIYGHNMRNGSMFANLHKFEKKKFFDEHDTIVIYTPEKKLTYTIFAAYKRDDAHMMKKYDYATEQGRQAFIDDIYTHEGNFREEVKLTTDDHIISLATCVGGEDDKRYIVQAVLTKEEAVIQEG